MQHEPPYTRRFWEQLPQKGTLIYEFQAVVKSQGETESRKIDGVILPDVPSVTIDGITKNEWPWEGLPESAKEVLKKRLQGQRVISVQTKAARCGFGLMGQSIFSPRLLELEGFGPNTPVEAVAVCGAIHKTLEDLLKKYGVTAHQDLTRRGDKRLPNRKEPDGTVKKDERRIRSYWKNLGKGSLAFDYPLLKESPRNTLKAHAVIWLDGPFQEVKYKQLPSQFTPRDEVRLLTTRIEIPRPGMNTMGRALFSWELMKLVHPTCKVSTAIACAEKDTGLEKLLKLEEFEHIEITPTEYRSDC